MTKLSLSSAVLSRSRGTGVQASRVAIRPCQWGAQSGRPERSNSSFGQWGMLIRFNGTHLVGSQVSSAWQTAHLRRLEALVDLHQVPLAGTNRRAPFLDAPFSWVWHAQAGSQRSLTSYSASVTRRTASPACPFLVGADRPAAHSPPPDAGKSRSEYGYVSKSPMERTQRGGSLVPGDSGEKGTSPGR